MQQLQGYIKKGHEKKVCKLKKGIYGLKQYGRKWYERLDRLLAKMRFTKSAVDPSLYYMRKGEHYLYLLVYVDDILLTSNSNAMISAVKGLLSAEFEMTELGEPACFLGVQISRNITLGTLSLNQKKYIDDILKRFSMTDAHPSSISLTAEVKLDKAETLESLTE